MPLNGLRQKLLALCRSQGPLLSSFVLRGPSFATNAIKLISRCCGVKPFTRYLEASLEAEFN
jgi:hypothetical protein